ncbi:unnamed protein product [Didymodactylos carnosus]|uniref:Enoyl reductase (ER) domain-containing protein n=1 Tax=Didymodactylos carnosus TaxID=1234261 RepID=A0A814G7F3_9BILA|nr:unnamed protein product [Didymodactylos carnosus]CAF0995052.1 unnamed protein product [Didymodactylos carnosus]CAF3582489.1 unnamed protein product [Didymodactylos carnosus]CAF3766740.1 unnamed protein product [Didymodactylos carnosus]
MTMRAVGVRKYGGLDVFEELENVPKPTLSSHGNASTDILIKVKACSVNPIDVKVRGGVYDDYPDYYDHVEPMKDGNEKYQILGFDGSGIIEDLGKSVEQTKFKKGDEVYYLASPFRQATNAEYVLVNQSCVALKPKSLTFEEAAGVPLTTLTAYQSLIERMRIEENEKCAILIINGAGGVGSAATQICSKILKLPIIICTASKEETQNFCKKMGATHVINHHEDIPKQIEKLNLQIPLKYAYITHTTVGQYVKDCSECLSPFGTMCSIVQGKFEMFGTKAMAKSLTFCWDLLGTRGYYKIKSNVIQERLELFAKLIDEKQIKSTVTKTFDFSLENLRKVHDIVENGGTTGKMTLKMSF